MYPVFAHTAPASPTVQLKLICNEADMHHKMVLRLDGIDGDPLQEPFLDNLNRAIFLAQLRDLSCEETCGGWQLAFTLEP